MKAEWLEKGPNSGFIVTNLSLKAKSLYEFYTERGGTCEVRIDEFKSGQAQLSPVYGKSVPVVYPYGSVLVGVETQGSALKYRVCLAADTAIEAENC
jgi:hypothetical protein